MRKSSQFLRKQLQMEVPLGPVVASPLASEKPALLVAQPDGKISVAVEVANAKVQSRPSLPSMLAIVPQLKPHPLACLRVAFLTFAAAPHSNVICASCWSIWQAETADEQAPSRAVHSDPAWMPATMQRRQASLSERRWRSCLSDC